MSSSLLSSKRLGYWFNEKKSKKLSISELEKAFRALNMEPVKIDLSRSLIGQGPFDGILHKLTDIISLSDTGSPEAQMILSNVTDYISLNPHVAMIDPIESIRILTDRFKTYNMVENCRFETKDFVFIPPFVALQSDCMEENIKLLHLCKITFPAVCKPIQAHGANAHEMTLIFNERGLSDCSFPCVIQSFVNHNAVIYKIFSIGERSFIVERQSITNLFLPKDFPSVHFHSGDVSQANNEIHQRKLELGLIKFQHHLENYDEIKPNEETLHCISNALRKLFNAGLLGIDVIIDRSTGHYAVVDINVFPAYSGVESFPDILADYIRGKLDNPN